MSSEKTAAEEALIKAVLAWHSTPVRHSRRLEAAVVTMLDAIAAVKQERGA